MSTSCLASESQPGFLEGAPQLRISLAANQQLLCLDDHPNWQIGRGKTNQIILPSKSVSRLHATIELVPVGNLYFAYFSDAGSLNGSFVNQRPVFDRIFLLDGDVITLGDATLTFHYPAQRTPTQLDALTNA